MKKAARVVIRGMHENDIDAIRQVEAMAFGPWWHQQSGQATALPQRTRTNILNRLARDPEGCFVAEDASRIVGFIFSCTWGGVGWFGTFSVRPEYQERGIGKQLIAASLAYLGQGPDRVIGLETMPETPNNLGLYLKMGFQPRLLTLILVKRLDRPGADKPNLPRWSMTDSGRRECWLANLREATEQISPGFDYTKEILLTDEHNLGETLILTDSERAIGLSNVQLANSREGPIGARATLQALALHPGYTNDETLQPLLDATEALAHAHAKQILVVAVNARHAWALERLLERGYQVERAMVRMVLQGMDEGPFPDGCVNLSRWAG